MKAQGFKVTQTGGDVTVVPTANPDQLGLFQSGGVDAVWTVEPWVTRLEREARAKVFLEDTNIITTWLACSVKFLNAHRDLAKKIVTANKELTDWIQAHPDEAQKLLITELKEETKADFAPEAVAQRVAILWQWRIQLAQPRGRTAPRHVRSRRRVVGAGGGRCAKRHSLDG